MKVLNPGPRAPRRRDEGDRRPLDTHPLRSGLVFLLALLAAAVVPIAAVWGVRTIASSRGGQITVNVPGENVVENLLPNTVGALLVTVDPEGVVVGLTVFAPNPSGEGGSVVVVPTSAATTGPDGAERRVGDAYLSGGLDAQQDAVENLLGVTLLAVEGTEAELADLVAPHAPFTVTFTDPVIDTIDDDDETISDAGRRDLTADDAAAVFVARKDGESELARLPRTVDVWRAILSRDEAVAPDPGTTAAADSSEDTSAGTASSAPTDLPGFLEVLTSGPTSVQTLPAASRMAADGVELFDIAPEFIHLLMAEVLPGAVSPADENAKVWLVEPGTDQFALLTATRKLDALPANLVMATSGGAEPQPARSILEYGNAVGEAAARQLAAAGTFGPEVEIRPSAEQTRGIDLTITLGADFASIVDAERAAATTTVAPSTSDTDSEDDSDTDETEANEDDS